MEVLVFANPKVLIREHVLNEISKVPVLCPKLVLEHGRFKSLLMEKQNGREAIVFIACDRKDMKFLASLKDYLSETRVILILPMKKPYMVKLGLSVSPCLITYANEDLSGVIAVLERISIHG